MTEPVKVGGETVYTTDAKKPDTERSYRFELFYSPGSESSTPFFAKLPQVFQTTLTLGDRIHAKTEAELRSAVKALGVKMSKTLTIETKMLGVRVLTTPARGVPSAGFDHIVAYRREIGSTTKYMSARQPNGGMTFGRDFAEDGTEVWHLASADGKHYAYGDQEPWRFVDWTPERELVAEQVGELLARLQAMLGEHFGSAEAAALLLDTGAGRLLLGPATT